MRLNEEIEKRWREFKADAEQYGAEHQLGEGNDPVYTDRDPISEQWDTRGKIVRLDDVIMACHLISARYSFRGLAGLQTKVLKQIGEFIGGFIAGALSKKLVGRVIGRNAIGQVVATIAGTIEESVMQADLERSIREASFVNRSDVFEHPMKANPRRRRATKLVFTRKPIPRQRKPNKSWRSPKR